MNHSVHRRLLKVQRFGSFIDNQFMLDVSLPGTDVDVTSGYSWLFLVSFFSVPLLNRVQVEAIPPQFH